MEYVVLWPTGLQGVKFQKLLLNFTVSFCEDCISLLLHLPQPSIKPSIHSTGWLPGEVCFIKWATSLHLWIWILLLEPLWYPLPQQKEAVKCYEAQNLAAEVAWGWPHSHCLRKFLSDNLQIIQFWWKDSSKCDSEKFWGIYSFEANVEIPDKSDMEIPVAEIHDSNKYVKVDEKCSILFYTVHFFYQMLLKGSCYQFLK